MRKLVVFIASLGLLAALVPAVAAARAGSDVEWAASGPTGLDPHLVGLLDEGGADDLVVFVHADTVTAAVGAVEATGLTLVDTFDRVGVAVAAGAPSAVRAVADQPGVTYVQADEPVELLLDTSHQATRGDEALEATFSASGGGVDHPGAARGKGAERSGGRASPPPFRSGGGEVVGPFDGSGVTIAVIDSGVDGTHEMFVDPETGDSKVVRNLKFACPTGAVLLDPLQQACLPSSEETGGFNDASREMWIDLTERGNDTDTPSVGGHGTHVASTAGGYARTSAALDDRNFYGAAPGATLVSLSVGQALSVYGGSAGLNWVLENHGAPCGEGVDAAVCPPIRVVNNSWGSGGTYNPNDIRSKLQHALIDEGIVVVWAAGNAGGDGSSSATNPPGQSPVPGVISVANYDDGNRGDRDNHLASTSSRGEKDEPSTYPDISAPGSSITAACRPYLAVCASLEADPNYGTIGGTSMAAPHVAGIVALLLQAQPESTPADVERVLLETAHPFTAGGAYESPHPVHPGARTSFDKGAGLVDAMAALEAFFGGGDGTATPECREHDEVFLEDGAGDAVTPGFSSSEPALDLRSAELDWDEESGTVTFTVALERLEESGDPPAFYDLEFRRGVDALGVRATRNVGSETFALRSNGETVQSGLEGAFDVDADAFWVTVPPEVLESAELEPLSRGDVLDAIQASSWRLVGVLGILTDDAGGDCVYLGRPDEDPDEPGEPGEPVEELDPPEEAEHAVGPSWPDAAWEGFTVSPTNGLEFGPEPCREVVPDGGCADTTWLFVTAPGEVTITVSGMLPGDDWDVYVYDEDGNQVAVGAEFGDESFTTALPAGLYEVVVTPWLAPSGEYSATASWSG